MKTPHKHAEVVKAWADGAEIEGRERDGKMWVLSQSPNWYVTWQYRVKPEPTLSAKAEILIAELVTQTVSDTVRDAHSLGQMAAYEALANYIISIEQQGKS